MPNVTANRQQLRKIYRHKRRELPTFKQACASRRLADVMTQLSIFKRAKHIAFYFASDGEISPKLIAKTASAQGKHCYFPTLLDDNALQFRELSKGTRLHKNRFNILEPLRYGKHCKPEQLDLVLLPLVSFDRTGARLGMGGGYYDRAFAFKQCRRPMKKPLLVGLAHTVQEAPKICTEDWDIPLDAIATPCHYHLTNTKHSHK